MTEMSVLSRVELGQLEVNERQEKLARLPELGKAQRKRLLKECWEQYVRPATTGEGGMTVAEAVQSLGLGNEEAERMIKRSAAARKREERIKAKMAEYEDSDWSLVMWKLAKNQEEKMGKGLAKRNAALQISRTETKLIEKIGGEENKQDGEWDRVRRTAIKTADRKLSRTDKGPAEATRLDEALSDKEIDGILTKGFEVTEAVKEGENKSGRWAKVKQTLAGAMTWAGEKLNQLKERKTEIGEKAMVTLGVAVGAVLASREMTLLLANTESYGMGYTESLKGAAVLGLFAVGLAAGAVDWYGFKQKDGKQTGRK